MSVSFSPMTSEDFSVFIEHSSQAFAREKINSGIWSEEEALGKAKGTFDTLLPEGLNTQEHQLFSILYRS
ncbi:hypothetical protein [Melghirimyces algeriensis]|uniref:Uncharacterized protein n=1 Tax=Melghirimyces algeriensis TaxID=910412 RepID=A0A521EF86_9BACL|nr:hypothetical protein [Melghirimyces algeriensis]SMO82525.1 hypothetical protein SAMN06264849_1093 [Melghirimyces algeriensis]